MLTNKQKAKIKVLDSLNETLKAKREFEYFRKEICDNTLSYGENFNNHFPEFEKILKQFENLAKRLLKDFETADSSNIFLDFWGSSGPDCISVQLEAA